MALRTLMVPTTARVTTPPGMIPQLISDSPKVASSAAMAISQETSGVNAPPKHQPFTMAMVGLGRVHELAPLPIRGRAANAHLLVERHSVGRAEEFAQIHPGRERVARTGEDEARRSGRRARAHRAPRPFRR